MSSVEQTTQDTAVLEPNTGLPAMEEADALDMDMVELELALDPQILQEFGFEHTLQLACENNSFDFLFQLPVFDLMPGQRIAVLTTGDRMSLLFAVLNDAGNDIELVAEDAMRSEIRNFADAFMEVFSRLGTPVEEDLIELELAEENLTEADLAEEKLAESASA